MKKLYTIKKMILLSFAVAVVALISDNNVFGADYSKYEAQNTSSCVEHNFVYVETVESTCSEKGYDLYTCSNCNAIKRVFKPLLEHKYEEVERINPTCTKEGYVLRRCTVCGEEDDEPLDKTDHDYKTVKVISKATNKKNGKANLVCKKCGHKENNKTIYKWTIDWPGMFNPDYCVEWTGKTIKYNKFKVLDSKGNIINKKYYTVKYKNNINIGIGDVTIVFKDIYSGKYCNSFHIDAKEFKIKSLKVSKNNFKISWKNYPYANKDSYYVAYCKDKKLLDKCYEWGIDVPHTKNNKIKFVKVSKNASSKEIKNLKKGKYYVCCIMNYLEDCEKTQSIPSLSFEVTDVKEFVIK